MQLHFREQGNGRALIILHGLFGSLDNWAYVSGQLAERFHVFSIDQRNHGQSPHSNEMNFPALAADLNEFMIQRGLESASVMGHSMGGKAAMEFALAWPEKVERLIVVDMATRAYPRRHDDIFEALLEIELGKFQTRAQVDEALTSKIPELAVRRFLLKGISQDAPGSLRWKFNLPVLHEHYSELTEALASERHCDKPALFIRGGKSDYILDDDLPQIRELFPRAELETIPEASHWVHAECADKFIKSVENFLVRNF